MVCAIGPKLGAEVAMPIGCLYSVSMDAYLLATKLEIVLAWMLEIVLACQA